MGTVPVWDPFVRLAHWTLFAAIVLAWLTRHGWGRWHEWIGYATIVVVVLRVIWGWLGPGSARFVSFVRSPRVTLRYAHDVLARSEHRHLGHNPLGAWMIIALLLDVLLAAFTGWLYTTDRYWGIEWVETLHAAFAEAIWWLAGLHVAGVLYASYRHKENLILAMLTGRKRA